LVETHLRNRNKNLQLLLIQTKILGFTRIKLKSKIWENLLSFQQVEDQKRAKLLIEKSLIQC